MERKKMTFFEICLDEISYNTQYLQVCIEKKKCLKIFSLREISSAAPIMGIIQANNQMCMWQTMTLIFNHMKCINYFTAIKVFSIPNVHLHLIQL